MSRKKLGVMDEPKLCNLTKARRVKGWSISDLSRISGISYKKIYYWEEGTTKPSIETMLKVQFALFDVRPLVFESSIFKSDEEFEAFVNSDTLLKLLQAMDYQEALAEQIDKSKEITLHDILKGLPERIKKARNYADEHFHEQMKEINGDTQRHVDKLNELLNQLPKAIAEALKPDEDMDKDNGD